MGSVADPSMQPWEPAGDHRILQEDEGVESQERNISRSTSSGTFLRFECVPSGVRFEGKLHFPGIEFALI